MNRLGAAPQSIPLGVAAQSSNFRDCAHLASFEMESTHTNSAASQRLGSIFVSGSGGRCSGTLSGNCTGNVDIF
jgi:hypothetical protein